MPRALLNYLPKMIGYTMPLVIDILDELNPPTEIRKVSSQREQGDLIKNLSIMVKA